MNLHLQKIFILSFFLLSLACNEIKKETSFPQKLKNLLSSTSDKNAEILKSIKKAKSEADAILEVLAPEVIQTEGEELNDSIINFDATPGALHRLISKSAIYFIGAYNRLKALGKYVKDKALKIKINSIDTDQVFSLEELSSITQQTKDLLDEDLFELINKLDNLRNELWDNYKRKKNYLAKRLSTKIANFLERSNIQEINKQEFEAFKSVIQEANKFLKNSNLDIGSDFEIFISKFKKPSLKEQEEVQKEKLRREIRSLNSSCGSIILDTELYDLNQRRFQLITEINNASKNLDSLEGQIDEFNTNLDSICKKAKLINKLITRLNNGDLSCDNQFTREKKERLDKQRKDLILEIKEKATLENKDFFETKISDFFKEVYASCRKKALEREVDMISLSCIADRQKRDELNKEGIKLIQKIHEASAEKMNIFTGKIMLFENEVKKACRKN